MKCMTTSKTANVSSTSPNQQDQSTQKQKSVFAKEKEAYQLQQSKLRERLQYLKDNGIPYRLIACDPGRRTIAFCVERLKDGTIRIYKYSREQNYEERGINNRNRLTKAWQEEIKDKENIFAEQSFKHAWTTEEVELCFLSYSLVFDDIWQAKLDPKYAQEDLRVHIMTAKSFDQFMQLIIDGGDQSVDPCNIFVAYGCADFPSSAKGERSVPTSSFFKAMAKFFNVIATDEFRSSRFCNTCTEALLEPHTLDNRTKSNHSTPSHDNLPKQTTSKKAKRKKNSKPKLTAIRGLRYCPSCRKYWDRDANAALNILDFANGKRCKIFKRGQPAVSDIEINCNQM